MPRSAWLLSLAVFAAILVLSNCETSGRKARGELEHAIAEVESVQKDFQVKTENLERKVRDLRAGGEQILNLAGSRDATDEEDDSQSEGRAVETAQGEDEDQGQGGNARHSNDSADEVCRNHFSRMPSCIHIYCYCFVFSLVGIGCS